MRSSVTKSRPLPSKQIVVDWSNEREIPVDALIEWIRQYPRRSDIHVYVPSACRRHAYPCLQTTLLKMGCTVTARVCTA
ncbi:MAG: hypothetical protein WCX61_00705 [Candidatus Peribacteraceae bacterium]